MRFGIALKDVCPTCHQVIPGETVVFQVGTLVVNPTRGAATVSGREVKLTPTERRILTLLAANAGDLVTYADLYEAGCGERVSERYKAEQKHALRVHISRLRAKLGDAARLIETVTGPIEEGGLRLRLRSDDGAAPALALGVGAAQSLDHAGEDRRDRDAGVAEVLDYRDQLGQDVEHRHRHRDRQVTDDVPAEVLDGERGEDGREGEELPVRAGPANF